MSDCCTPSNEMPDVSIDRSGAERPSVAVQEGLPTLRELPIGGSAFVQAVGGEGSLRQHLLDMGLIPGVKVTMVKHAPMGDPVEVQSHG